MNTQWSRLQSVDCLKSNQVFNDFYAAVENTAVAAAAVRCRHYQFTTTSCSRHCIIIYNEDESFVILNHCSLVIYRKMLSGCRPLVINGLLLCLLAVTLSCCSEEVSRTSSVPAAESISMNELQQLVENERPLPDTVFTHLLITLPVLSSHSYLTQYICTLSYKNIVTVPHYNVTLHCGVFSYKIRFLT